MYCWQFILILNYHVLKTVDIMIYCRYWPYTWGGWYQYLPCTQDCWHLYSINYHVLLMVDININQITMYIWELVLIHVFNMYILLTVDMYYWQIIITMYLGLFISVQFLAYVLQMVDIDIYQVPKTYFISILTMYSGRLISMGLMTVKAFLVLWLNDQGLSISALTQ